MGPACDTSWMVYGMVGIQGLGLVSMWLARLSHGCTWESFGQRVFLICLALVGLTALAAPTLGPCHCLSAGFALAMMVVGAITDFGDTAVPAK